MEQLIKKINFNKIGNITMIVAGFAIVYYSIYSYKAYLEIKELNKKA